MWAWLSGKCKISTVHLHLLTGSLSLWTNNIYSLQAKAMTNLPFPQDTPSQGLSQLQIFVTADRTSCLPQGDEICVFMCIHQMLHVSLARSILLPEPRPLFIMGTAPCICHVPSVNPRESLISILRLNFPA